MITGSRSGRVEVRSVAWDDPAAAGLRAAMQAEMEARYADRVADVLARAAAPESRLHSTLGVEAEQVAYVGVAYAGDAAVGHVALRWLDGDLELKRMYVAPGHRGSGAARVLLAAAEGAARSLGASRIILQTGDRQPEAVRLYEREGYAHIPVFPPYEWLDFSVCMEKVL